MGELADTEEKAAQEQEAASMKPLLERLSKALGDRVKEVRVTVKSLAHAAGWIDGVAVLAGQHQRRDAGHLGLVGQHLQIEHQVEMRLESGRNADRSLGQIETA